MSFGPEELTEIRRKMLELEFRAKSDEGFLQELKDDPVGVLRANGLEDPVAREAARQLTGESAAEAGGCDHGTSDCIVCETLTCIVTGCCFWTEIRPIVVKA